MKTQNEKVIQQIPRKTGKKCRAKDKISDKLQGSVKYPQPSANDLTAFVIQYLNLHGFKVWRCNNMGVYDAVKGIYRKNPNALRGVPDVTGYRKKDGCFVGIEVKAGKDKLSEFQNYFISHASEHNCICFAIWSGDEFLEKIKPHLN
jgi:hypothetical protein